MSGTLPRDGQRIRCHLKNGDIVTGTVLTVWTANDTPCVNLQFHNAVIQVWPGLGDTWEDASA